MKLPTTDDFARITAKVNAAIALASARKEQFAGDSINWGCFELVRLRWFVNAWHIEKDLSGIFLATLSEADPCAFRVKEFLEGQLADENVEFETEW